MKTLHIEWRHYETEGKTCERCATTGETLAQVLDGLAGTLRARGVEVAVTEVPVPESGMSQSNMILFNGIPLEEVLTGAAVTETPCPSCSCLAGRETECRAVEFQGTTYEAIPPELIREALLKAIDRL